ncbi:MAG: hypothetical protein MMC33_007498 [Icmadophila ericetorum]|nr:hypothetical protein [Icmadophila ericetorum]
MAPINPKKRKHEDGMKGKTTRPYVKRMRQEDYDSSSSHSDDVEVGFTPVNLADSDEEPEDLSPPSTISTQPRLPNSADKASSASNSDSSASEEDSDDLSDPDSTSNPNLTKLSKKPTKRHDPEAFSTSLQAILSSKLTTQKRTDPVLSRSKSALEASHALSEEKIERKAKKTLRDQKKKSLEKGRVRDVLLGERAELLNQKSSTAAAAGGDEEVEKGGVSAAQIAEQERRLRKTAQRGVVKLFNAVKQAQVKALEAEREARKGGVVGAKRKEERVGEMSKQGFLEMIAGGGKMGEGKGKEVVVEET